MTDSSEHTTKASTADRILDAADELFGQHGYDGVSIRDVADRADVNKASVFYHYKSKDELFERVLERYYSAHHRALEQAFQQDGTLRSRVHHVIDAYIDFILQNRRFPGLVQTIVNSSQDHLPFIQRSMGMLLAWTEVALGDVTPATGPLSARQFYVTIAGAVIHYFVYAPVLEPVWGEDPMLPEGVTERREHLHWLIDTALNGLRAEGIVVD
ncbi:MAG: TetR family transcriptional regulator [Myxococcota bacterium]